MCLRVLPLRSWGVYVPTPISLWLRVAPGHANSLALLSTQAGRAPAARAKGSEIGRVYGI